MERHDKRASTDGFRECPLISFFSLIVSAIERISAHALARLECDGNAGTCHEQRHHGEEGRARSTGKRQLGDVLHVLDLVRVVIGDLSARSQAPDIGTCILDGLTVRNGNGKCSFEIRLEACRNLGLGDLVSTRPQDP